MNRASLHRWCKISIDAAARDMITAEENQLLTQTDPQTPCGELLRRYWQPVALSEELPKDGAPLKVKILGEELVLFRDDQGRLGLIGLHCSHRSTDLSYGRIEDGGLRCLYHGWLYDVCGRILDQPGEPGGGANKNEIRHRAHPCASAFAAIPSRAAKYFPVSGRRPTDSFASCDWFYRLPRSPRGESRPAWY